VRTPLADDGFVPPPAAEADRDDSSSVGDVRGDTSSTGAELRAWEDIRAEEFHVAALCESEEVAAEQARALTRTHRGRAQVRRELAQARCEHRAAVSERASLLEVSAEPLCLVEGELYEARTAAYRARDVLRHLELVNTSLTGELA